MVHKIFVTDAVVKAFGDLNSVERYAKDTAKKILEGQTVGYILADPAGNHITVDTERYEDRIIVSIRGDNDNVTNCLECLKAGRIETGTIH